MDSSVILTRSISENTPLLIDSSTSVNYERANGIRSIFTCGVVSILFAELCERLTFYGIGGNLVIFATDSVHLNITATQASILSYVFQGTLLIWFFIYLYSISLKRHSSHAFSCAGTNM